MDWSVRPIAMLASVLITAMAGPANVGAQEPGPPVAQHPPSETSGNPPASQDVPAGPVEHEQARFRVDAAACERGDQAACSDLGKAYELGLGTAQNRPIAEILYREACDAGIAESCYRLGRVTTELSDDGAYEQAATNYARACALGSAQGCIEHAWSLHRGLGVARDEQRAETLWRDSCSAGAGAACRELAIAMIFSEPTGERMTEAVKLLAGQCDALDAKACGELLRLEEGASGRPSEVWILHKACSGGSAWHCKDLGDRAYLGNGTVQDRDYAFLLYDRACALDGAACEVAAMLRQSPALSDGCGNGDMAACARLGEIRDSGETVLEDAAEALELLAAACLGQIVEACARAGGLLLEAGQGDLLADPARAETLLVTGCDGGSLAACDRLARALDWGHSLPQDIARAHLLYVRLCEAEWWSACKTLSQNLTAHPDMPLAAAGTNFVPPIEQGDRETLLSYLPEEIRAEMEYSPCSESTLEFRGKLYTDVVCDQTQRVLKGYPLEPGQAPWQALLWRPQTLPNGLGPLSAKQRVLCGGALIKRGWVLTAAHCLVDRLETGEKFPVRSADYRIRLGVHRPAGDEGISYPILEVHEHPFFDQGTYAFDIALIRYDPRRGESGAATNAIALIGLDETPLRERRIAPDMDVYTYGWGRTEVERVVMATELMGAKLQLETLGRCTEITGFTGSLRNAALCAAGDEGQQACYGDSGGPLIYYDDADRRPRVIGVVSSGRKCGTTGEASRYTRVARARQWIERTIANAP